MAKGSWKGLRSQAFYPDGSQGWNPARACFWRSAWSRVLPEPKSGILIQTSLGANKKSGPRGERKDADEPKSLCKDFQGVARAEKTSLDLRDEGKNRALMLECLK